MGADAEYDEFLADKVQAAREALQRGEGLDHDEVQAEFSRRRKAAKRPRQQGLWLHCGPNEH